MSASKKKRWISSLLRWGIAVIGITYVLWNMRFHDRVRILNQQGELGEVLVWNDANDSDPVFTINDGQTQVRREELWTLPDRKTVAAPDPKQPTVVKQYKLLAVRPAGEVAWPGGDGRGAPPAAELFVEDPDTKQRMKLSPAIVLDRPPPAVTYPLVERGIN